jgi:hypothetical protein
VSYLKSPRSPPPPPPAYQKGVSIWDLGLLAVLAWLVVRVLSLSSTTVYLLYSLRRTASVMARKKATADELDARAEANGYQRGAHREEDSRRDGNKHEDKTNKN